MPDTFKPYPGDTYKALINNEYVIGFLSNSYITTITPQSDGMSSYIMIDTFGNFYYVNSKNIVNSCRTVLTEKKTKHIIHMSSEMFSKIYEGFRRQQLSIQIKSRQVGRTADFYQTVMMETLLKIPDLASLPKNLTIISGNSKKNS